MYGATERFLLNFNEQHKFEQNIDVFIEELNSKEYFSHFIFSAITWWKASIGLNDMINPTDYWIAIQDQDEPEIFRLNEQMK